MSRRVKLLAPPRQHIAVNDTHRDSAPSGQVPASGDAGLATPAADELLLSDLVRPLWEWRYVIAATTIAGAALALAYAAAQTTQYEATAVIRVIESKSGDQAEPARADTYRPLLENKTLAAGLVKDFALVREPAFRWGAGGGPVPADVFVRNHLRVDQAGPNLLRVNVRLGNADVAARVTNALVERAIDLNRRINQQEVVEARDSIKTQLDEAAARLEQVANDLVATKRHSQVDALKKDVEGALDLRGKLLELQASIENERAFLARSEADLARTQPLLTTRRSIDRDAALMEAARAEAPGTSVLGLGMTDQQVNEAYSYLEQQVAESRAKLAGLESQRRLLVDEKRLDRAELPALTRLYEGDVAVSRLQAEYEMALKVYTDLTQRHEDARIRVVGRGAQLQVVDAAVPPSLPSAVGRGPTVALGAFGGALIACLVVLGRAFLSRTAGH